VPALILWLAVALGAEVDTSGELRVIETMPSTWALDADGRTHGWGPVVDTRVRAGLAVVDGVARGDVQIDALSGQLFGSTWTLSPLDERRRHLLDATSGDGVLLRRLVAGVRLPVADVEVGVVTSHWGLGLVANDGSHTPDFGRSDFGDRVARLRLATQPLGADVPLYAALMGDRVLFDELARQDRGDEAWQAIAALLWRQKAQELGVYGVHRRQTDDDGRYIRATVVDVYGRITRDLAEGWTGQLAVETAAIVGATDVSRTLVAPEGIGVASTGGMVRAEAGSEPVGGVLKLAWASGDGSSDDDVLSDFRFDRDLDVGMVLFDEVLSAIDLAALDAATDPDAADQPPEGVEALAQEGAFQRAVALQPIVELRPTRAVEVKLGGVFAWSTGPIAHPVETFRNGGVPTNHLGRPSDGRYLGTELDWSVGTRLPDQPIQPQVTLQGGHAWLSEALSGEVQRVDHLLLIGRLRW
jgi:hypothetical protein